MREHPKDITKRNAEGACVHTSQYPPQGKDGGPVAKGTLALEVMGRLLSCTWL